MRSTSIVMLLAVVILAFAFAGFIKAHPPGSDAMAMHFAQYQLAEEQAPTLLPVTIAHRDYIVQAEHEPDARFTRHLDLNEDGQQLRRRDLERVGPRGFYRIE